MQHYISLFSIVLVMLLSCSRGQQKSSDIVNTNFVTEAESTEYAVPTDEEQQAEIERIYSSLPEESFEERFECFNPWHKDFFKNEWGEQDPNKPFLYTTLSGTSWNIHIDYSPADYEDPYGTFRFYIVDGDGYITSSFGPVNILIRSSDGKTKSVAVTGTRDYVTFVEDPSTVLALKQLLDQETFDIQMQFEKYNERHTTMAKWDSEPGFFQHAIDTML